MVLVKGISMYGHPHFFQNRSIFKRCSHSKQSLQSKKVIFSNIVFTLFHSSSFCKELN